MADLSILMPAYNEEATIEEAIERALAVELPVAEREVIVVENGSSDRTREIIESRSWPEQVRVIKLDENQGKGGAIRLAAQAARGNFVALLDADLEYEAADIARMLPQLEDERIDVVFGTRAWQAHSAYSYWYVKGNLAINAAANVLYNVWLSDCMAGLKVMRTDLFRSLDLRENGFSFEAEVVARLLRGGARVFEVPITYRARTREEGKKLRAREGVRMLATFIRCRVS